MPEPYYTTTAALIAEPGLAAVSAADATKIIENAEDLIDELLGGWPIDKTTGRKIVQAQVEAWQWTKLGRATLKLAVALYKEPDLARRNRWASEKGPDFAVSGPIGGAIATEVLAPLNQSGLRRIAGRATPSGGGRFDNFFRYERG
jgi:hypothetical protein